VAVPAGWLFWNPITSTHSLVKKTQYRHNADFKPQRAPPLRKRARASKYSEKPPGPER
jgi:hypothetical protein